MQETPHLYIDATYISTKDYYQLVIIMAYYTLIDLKFPCSYILMNNKNEKSYELVFKNLLNIITMDNSIDLKIISITTDFEKGILNAVKTVFKNIRYVGCMFHYIKNLRLNLLKIGLINNEISNLTKELLINLGTISFKINDNPNIIEEIFKRFETQYKGTDYIKNFKRFEKYIYDTWIYYINNWSLNYIFINKKQRTNSYLENYNRRLKDILGPSLNRRGKTIIPWPLLLVFLKNEEKYFRNRIKYKLTEEPKKIDKIKFITIANEKEDKIQDIIKNNNIPLIRWLGYKSYSCRYDSFLFLFFTTIYKIY